MADKKEFRRNLAAHILSQAEGEKNSAVKHQTASHKLNDMAQGLAKGGEVEYLPCKNKLCKSYGHAHPNCECYAHGGQVCQIFKSHLPSCKYFAAGGMVDPIETPAQQPLDDSSSGSIPDTNALLTSDDPQSALAGESFKAPINQYVTPVVKQAVDVDANLKRYDDMLSRVIRGDRQAGRELAERSIGTAMATVRGPEPKQLPEVVFPDGPGPAIKLEPEVSPLGFYSPLEREVHKMDFNQMPAKDLSNRINNIPGVKAEELEFTGIQDFLDMKHQAGEKVSKAEVQQYLKDNGVKVEQTVLGGDKYKAGKELEDGEQANGVDWQEPEHLEPDSDAISSEADNYYSELKRGDFDEEWLKETKERLTEENTTDGELDQESFDRDLDNEIIERADKLAEDSLNDPDGPYARFRVRDDTTGWDLEGSDEQGWYNSETGENFETSLEEAKIRLQALMIENGELAGNKVDLIKEAEVKWKEPKGTEPDYEKKQKKIEALYTKNKAEYLEKSKNDREWWAGDEKVTPEDIERHAKDLAKDDLTASYVDPENAKNNLHIKIDHALIHGEITGNNKKGYELQIYGSDVGSARARGGSARQINEYPLEAKSVEDAKKEAMKVLVDNKHVTPTPAEIPVLNESGEVVKDPLAHNNPIGKAKWGQYKVPGGENYREVLLQLPKVGDVKVDPNRIVKAEANFTKAALENGLTQAEADKALQYVQEERAIPNFINKQKNATGLIDSLNEFDYALRERDNPPTGDKFHYNTHFDQPNILAHVRMSDRVIDGKKTLFVEELQSDWHQQGRERGYKGDIVEPKPGKIFSEQELNSIRNDFKEKLAPFEDAVQQYSAEKREALYSQMRSNPSDLRRMIGTTAPSIQEAYNKGAITIEDLKNMEAVNAQAYQQPVRTNEVPNAPYKNTDAWAALAMKRIIRLASEEGYDAIAWTPAAVHVDRWGTESVGWTKKAGGEKFIVSHNKENQSYDVIPENQSHGKPVEDGTFNYIKINGKTHNRGEVYEKQTALKAAEAKAQELTAANSGPHFLVGSVEQRGGHAGDVNIEDAARAQGKLLERDGERVTTKEELRKVIKSTLGRERNDRSLDSLTDNIWKQMQEKESGAKYPRKEGMEFFYDSMLPNKAVPSIIKKLDPQAKVGVAKLDINFDKSGNIPEYAKAVGPHKEPQMNVWHLPLTDAIKAKAKEGLSLFYKGGMVPNQTQNFAFGGMVQGFANGGRITPGINPSGLVRPPLGLLQPLPQVGNDVVHVYDLKTGQLGTIPHDQVDGAISSGEYAFPKGQSIPVISPDGQLGTIPPEEAPGAFSEDGFKYASPDTQKEYHLQKEYGEGLGNELKAAALGAANTASFGLANQALARSGMVSPEALKELPARNPIAHGLGSAAGIVGPMLVGDEAGPLNLVRQAAKAGEGVGEAAGKLLPEATTTAGKILQSAATKGIGSAAEGSFYGLGQVIGEQALGDPDYNAEAMRSQIGHTALLFGGLGGILGAAEIAIPASVTAAKDALDKIKESPLAQKLADKVGDAYDSASAFVSGKDKADITLARVNRGELDAAKENVEGVAKDAAENYQDFHDEMEKASRTVNKDIRPEETEKLLRGIDEAPIQQQYAKTLKSLQDTISDLRSEPELYSPATARKLEMYRDRYLGKPGSEGDLMDVTANEGAVFPKMTVDDVIPGNPAEVFDSMNDLKRRLDQEIKYGRLSTDPVVMRTQSVLKGLRSDVKNALENESVFGQAASRQAAFNEATTAFSHAAKDFEKNFMSKTTSPSGSVVYKADPIKLMTYIKNIDNLRGAAKTDVLTAYHLAANNYLEQIEKSYASLPGKAFDRSLIDAAAGKSAEMYHEGIREAGMQSVFNRLAPGVESAGSGAGEIAGGFAAHALGVPTAVIGPIVGAHNILANPLFTMRRLAAVEKLVQKANAAIDKGAKSLFKNVMSSGDNIARFASSQIIPHTAVDGAHDKRVNEIEDLGNSPQKLMQKLQDSTEKLTPVAPKTAQSLQVQSATAIGFLKSKLPEIVTTPLGQKLPPNKADINKFNRYYEAVENPSNVFKQMKAGMLTSEAVETLQNVYPKLYNQMKTDVIDNITQLKGKPIPYTMKMQLSLFLGHDLDLGLNPMAIASNQVVQQIALAQKQQKDAQLINPTSKGMSAINVSQRSLTPSQMSANRKP